MGADAGLVSWSRLSGALLDGVRTSLGSEVTSAASSQWRTSWPPRKAQLTGCAECWTRRRRLWRRRGRGVEMPAGVAAASDETGRGVPGPTTGRPGVPRRGGVGAAGAAGRRRRGRGRGGTTEPAKALCRDRSWHQPPTGGWMLSPHQPPTGGWTGLAVRGWKRRRVDAATERRRHEADCPLPGRTWRELRAKGAGPMRRLGETRRTS